MKNKKKFNKDNKLLLLVTEECDENFYTHGGYVFGDNGLLIKTCVASYWDFDIFLIILKINE